MQPTLPVSAPGNETSSNHVINVIQTLEVMVRNAGEHQLPYVQEVLDTARNTLVQWIAHSDYYQPVRDTLLQMLQNDYELS